MKKKAQGTISIRHNTHFRKSTYPRVLSGYISTLL